ncbi:MAG: 6-phospho-beta-glucosidase, partial [Anaerolineae bacterium]
LQQRSAIASLTVEAAVHGDRQAALQALLLDPVVNSYTAAAALLDDLLAAQAGYLPTFAPT